MRKKLNQVIPLWMSEGIFFNLKSIKNIPWGDSAELAHRLDLVYHGNHSGDKYISPLVEKLLDDDIIKSTDVATLANIIYDINGENWKKLWEVNTIEYNPLSNYDMTETEHVESEGTNTGTITTDNDSTNTGTVGTVGNNSNSTNVNSSNSSSGNTDTNVFGFNSETSVGDSEVSSGTTSTDASTSTSNDSINTTVTNNLTSTDDTTVTNNLASSDKTVRTLSRTGNIGVTTSQQMAQSSIDLARWKFFETVFNDIDAILTLSVY